MAATSRRLKNLVGLSGFERGMVLDLLRGAKDVLKHSTQLKGILSWES